MQSRPVNRPASSQVTWMWVPGFPDRATARSTPHRSIRPSGDEADPPSVLQADRSIQRSSRYPCRSRWRTRRAERQTTYGPRRSSRCQNSSTSSSRSTLDRCQNSSTSAVASHRRSHERVLIHPRQRHNRSRSPARRTANRLAPHSNTATTRAGSPSSGAITSQPAWPWPSVRFHHTGSTRSRDGQSRPPVWTSSRFGAHFLRTPRCRATGCGSRSRVSPRPGLPSEPAG